MMLMLDVAPDGTTIAAGVAAGFFLVFAAVAFIAYKAMKRTAKASVKFAVVGIILFIATACSLVLWYFSSSGTQKLKPPSRRSEPQNKRK